MKQKPSLLRLIIKYPFLIVTGLFILVFSVWFLCKKDTVFSEAENRYLARQPELFLDTVLDSSFMTSYETYVNEQFPLRDNWITVKAAAEAVTGKQENNGIIKGKNGYLFSKDIAITEQAEKNVEQLRRFGIKAASEGFQTVLSVIPNSNAILTDYLPAGAPVFDQKKQMAEYRDRFEDGGGEGARWLDLVEVLKQHRKEPIYYHTDHHWTTLGAYYAYTAFAQFEGFKPVEMEEYKTASREISGFYGTLDAKYKGIGVKPDTITYYNIPAGKVVIDGEEKPGLYDESKIKVRDKYAMFLYGNNALTEITSDRAENGRRLLILKDSYANSLVPFLIPHYEKLYVVDLRYFNRDVMGLARKEGITDIWLLYNFDTLVKETHFYRLKG